MRIRRSARSTLNFRESGDNVAAFPVVCVVGPCRIADDMCGRFTIRTPAEQLAHVFHLASFPSGPPRYNISPTQLVLCVRAIGLSDQTREAAELQWGLVPSWAKDVTIGNRMINARSETAATKPSFRSAFKRRRCLIPADGFYEWRKQDDGSRQPWFIHQPADEPFGFAGLWESWTSKEDPKMALETCTILTTTANADLVSLHDRMPVILPFEQHATWLSDAASPGQLQDLMKPLPDGSLIRHPVSQFVNKAGRDEPECIVEMAVPDDTLPRKGTLFE